MVHARLKLKLIYVHSHVCTRKEYSNLTSAGINAEKIFSEKTIARDISTPIVFLFVRCLERNFNVKFKRFFFLYNLCDERWKTEQTL